MIGFSRATSDWVYKGIAVETKVRTHKKPKTQTKQDFYFCPPLSKGGCGDAFTRGVGGFYRGRFLTKERAIALIQYKILKKNTFLYNKYL